MSASLMPRIIGVSKGTAMPPKKLLTEKKVSRPSRPGRATMYFQPKAASCHNEPLPAWPAAEVLGRGMRTANRVRTAKTNVTTSAIKTPFNPTLTISAPAMAGASRCETAWPICTMPPARPRCSLGTRSVVAAE